MMKIRFLIAAATILLFGGCAGDAFYGPFDGPYLGGVGGGMGDTTSMAVISPRVISMEADFTAVDFTAAAGTGRREEEITNGKSQIAN
jgi:hypothetical protein